MADIHIGKINQSETNKGKAQLIYHIPVDTPKAGIVPTPQSSLTGLEQTEIDALAAGTLVEITKDIVVEKSQTQTEKLPLRLKLTGKMSKLITTAAITSSINFTESASMSKVKKNYLGLESREQSNAT